MSLVAKGYVQHCGIDDFETFSPVARFETLRMLCSMETQMEWKVYQFYVKSAFLNRYLDEHVYIEQLEDFFIQGNENKVYKLKKDIIWVEARRESMACDVAFTPL